MRQGALFDSQSISCWPKKGKKQNQYTEVILFEGGARKGSLNRWMIVYMWKLITVLEHPRARVQ